MLGLRRALAFLGLSLSRFHAWARLGTGCQLDDQPSCPVSSPQRLTPSEILAMRRMATDEDLKHVPTGRLALLAQRSGAVFASTSTWYRLVRERGWRRPRFRIHPHTPVDGVRASKPNEIWHIDVTVLKLLDGTRAYLHAVIDNFSRRILAWRLESRRCGGNTLAVLESAAQRLEGVVPTLLADSGSENVNRQVDGLVAAGVLTRVLAQVEIGYSNSMIEALWRSMKHSWLYLNTLDTIGRLRSLVAFYVAEHNARIAVTKRRKFTAEYKLELLKEADACRAPGELGAFLRREGLYSSHLPTWREQRRLGPRAWSRSRPTSHGLRLPGRGTARAAPGAFHRPASTSTE